MESKLTHPSIFYLDAMLAVRGGVFKIGDSFGEGAADEYPVRNVKVGSFALSRTCISFDEYDYYCICTGKPFVGDSLNHRGKLPVVNVTWLDAVDYCNWLSEEHGLDAVYDIRPLENEVAIEVSWENNGFRLPTEAEWEFAARLEGKYARYANGLQLPKHSVMHGGAHKRGSVPVNSKSPDALGFYHLCGNVWEFCNDWYGFESYANIDFNNPKGVVEGWKKVIRGGAWNEQLDACRISRRESLSLHDQNNFTGFRVARSILM